jgi:hypothetical protein
LAALLRPLVKLDVAAIRTHRQAMRQHERDLATWKAQRGELPEAPKPPRRVVVMDTTAEAVGVRLDESPLGLLLARDELGAWFGGFDQYRSGRGADAQKWLEMYDARPVFVDRKGGPAIAIPRAAVSVAGCATPAVVAGGLLGSHEEDGMLPRMLLVKPPRTPARWTNRIVTPRIAAEYRHLVDGLLALTMAGDQDGAPEPHVVRLSEAALRRWIAWFDEAASRDVETVGFEAAVRAKSRAWALRFALVHHTCRHVHGDPNVREDEIDDASLHAGILLADWHVNESLRVREELAGKLRKPEDADLIAWMERRGGRASVRDVQRGGPKRLRGSADDAEAGLMRVVDAGWAEWDETPAAPTGGPAQRVAVLYVFLPVATGDTRLDFPEDPEPPSPVAAPPVDPSSPTPLAARASPEDVDEALGAVERAMVAGDAGAEQEAAGRLLRLVGASEAASLLAGLRPAAQRQPGTSAAGEGAL